MKPDTSLTIHSEETHEVRTYDSHGVRVEWQDDDGSRHRVSVFFTPEQARMIARAFAETATTVPAEAVSG